VRVRAERPDDYALVREINRAAFGRDAEADLVDRLRAEASSIISLVGEKAGQVVGHILFSPVTLSGHDTLPIAGLAPMAVLPTHQRAGMGSALVNAGLDACRDSDFVAVVVVGHPAYYTRFGFRPASQFGLACEFEVPDDVFMALEVEDAAFQNRQGTIHYHPLFRTV
jgi:putative acetyltransferase